MDSAASSVITPLLPLHLLMWFMVGLVCVVGPARMMTLLGCTRCCGGWHSDLYAIFANPNPNPNPNADASTDSKPPFTVVLYDDLSDADVVQTEIGYVHLMISDRPDALFTLDVGRTVRRDWYVEFDTPYARRYGTSEHEAALQALIVDDLTGRGETTQADHVRKMGQNESHVNMGLVALDFAIVTFLGRIFAWIAVGFARWIRDLAANYPVETARQRALRLRECPSCRYCIAHLTEAHCPECGEKARPGDDWPIDAAEHRDDATLSRYS